MSVKGIEWKVIEAMLTLHLSHTDFQANEGLIFLYDSAFRDRHGLQLLFVKVESLQEITFGETFRVTTQEIGLK